MNKQGYFAFFPFFTVSLDVLKVITPILDTIFLIVPVMLECSLLQNNILGESEVRKSEHRFAARSKSLQSKVLRSARK